MSAVLLPQPLVGYLQERSSDPFTQFLQQGVSVILDGTFARRAWRDSIYALADEFGVTDVIAITCRCSDPLVVEQRLAYRRAAPDSPDAPRSCSPKSD